MSATNTTHKHSTLKDVVLFVNAGESVPPVHINWNCPCIPPTLKNGPCREAFAASFACFTRSITEPKGMDCQLAFERMNQCLAANPDVQPLGSGAASLLQ